MANIPTVDDIIDAILKYYKIAIKLGKRLFFGAAVLAGVGFIVWVWLSSRPDETAIKNYPSTGTTVVAFGDSLVEGVGANRSEGFVKILQDRVGVKIFNVGRAGDTTASALGRVEQVIAMRPDIVMVLLGGNDALQRVAVNDVFVNLETIIARLQDAGALVIVLGVPSGVFFDEYRDNFDRLPSRAGVLYVPDITEGWFDRTALKYDAIHPNDGGYEVIADKVEPVLRDALWGGK